MANTQSDLNKRLLRLFPVQVLREQFSITGSSQNEIVDELAENNTTAALINFACENFEHTKQHAYIYDSDRTFDLSIFDPGVFPLEIIQSARTRTGIVLFCLPKVSHRAILINPFATSTIEFYQPLRITVDGKRLTLQFTIVEKNLSAHFSSARFSSSKIIKDESAIKGELLEYFAGDYQLVSCDMNKGLKHLLETDVIDCKYVKFRRSKSVTTETMDVNATYKSTYPNEYKEMMKAPLSKTVLKYLLDDDELCDLFTADPSKGELSFNKYPATSSQIQNVINKIISNN